MGLSAQNTILKTLEEPSTHAVIILIANTIDSFLPTIISRTRNLLFNGLRKEN
jgi:DNA polymerase III gamma/tau subunit